MPIPFRCFRVVLVLPAARATVATAAAAVTATAATTVAAAVVATAAASAAAVTTTTAAATTVATTTAATERTGLRLEAVTAVDGAIAARLEGDLGVLATRSACHAEHLAVGAAEATTTTSATGAGRTLADTPTVRTPARLIAEPLRCMEFLFTSGERKAGATIDAG